MIKTYFVDSNGVSKETIFPFFKSKMKYDDVVDRSTFRPDSEQVRAFHLTGAGSNANLAYDDESNLPSDLEVEIRSGKLDKAEVSQLLLKKSKEVKENVSELKKEKAEKKKQEIAEARQDYLDKATGFVGSDQKQTVK